MDREKVIKAYEDFVNGYECFCTSDDYEYEMHKAVLALLKEQETQKFFVDESGKITPLPVVVRCKDCKHRGDRNKCIVAFVAEKQEMPYFFYDNRGEWFCADGVRRDE